MGLFVVARLAARHGIRVRLRPASMGGLTALVWLPDEVITHDTSVAPPGLRKFDVTTPGAPAEAAAASRTAEWPEPGQSEDRTAAMEAVNAARTPRFTPLRPDLGDTASFSALDADGAAPASEPAADYDSGAVPPVAPPATPVEAEPDGLPVLSAPTASLSPGLDLPRDDEMALPTFRTDTTGQTAQHGVIVPPPVGTGEENRLPIFESVESDWFRRGRHGADHPAVRPDVAAAAGSWSSPADAGWEAAEVAHAPVSSGTTGAGLPKRMPKANLVPGGVGGTSPAPPAPARSAAQARERLASFQRGVREARASKPTGDSPNGEDGDSAT